MKQYKVTESITSTCGLYDQVEIGDIVYKTNQYDYGLARDDTWATGVLHISVSLEPTGAYPIYTVPLSSLEEIP